MTSSGIMKPRIVLILATLLFGDLYAQDSVRPVYYDYNYIELNLTLKDSEGHRLYFIKRDNEPVFYSARINKIDTISRRKEYIVTSFYNQYRIGSCGPKDLPEMEQFYKNVYENEFETYWRDPVNHFSELLIKDFRIFSKNKTIIMPVDNHDSFFIEDCLLDNNSMAQLYKDYDGYPFSMDVNFCYRYAASDNVVYDPTDLLGERVVETPYFVPIGYLELFFVEDNKLMRIDFELYDYKKMGFTRPVYDPKTGEFPRLKLFMEIQFQEGEFVVTDESYPNLKPQKYLLQTKI